MYMSKMNLNTYFCEDDCIFIWYMMELLNLFLGYFRNEYIYSLANAEFL